eukprot:scaffold257875_cov14-Tisochrysis_lutea.AAC.1
MALSCSYGSQGLGWLMHFLEPLKTLGTYGHHPSGGVRKWVSKGMGAFIELLVAVDPIPHDDVLMKVKTEIIWNRL